MCAIILTAKSAVFLRTKELKQMKLRKRYLFLCALVIFTFVVLLRTRSSGLGVVEGWDKNTSRNVHDYVDENLEPHIMPEEFCAQKGLLLVAINSKPDNFEARIAIRETWAQKRFNVSFFFLLGEVRTDPDLTSKLYVESRRHYDIVQERFVDHYNNLTIKSVNMLKLFNSYCSNSYKYLMKIDDDVFLNIDLVVEMLHRRNKTTDLLIGKIMNGTRPFRDKSSKWFVPYEWYPEEEYPNYLCGSTYLMSADVVQKLYRCALNTPLFYIEDVYVTGICAKKMNLVPQSDPLFTCYYDVKDFCVSKHLYSIHDYTPDDMRSAQKILVNKECPVKIGWRDWFFFFNRV